MTERLVFIGDSITDCERKSDSRQLGHGYVDVLNDALAERGADVELINRGISGNRVQHLRERWQEDALALEPDVLTVYIGVNDTLSTFFQGRPTPPADFERDLDDILSQAVAAGVPRIILVDPFFVPDSPWHGPWAMGLDFVREDLDSKRPLVKALAEKHGARFVPLQDAVDTASAERGAKLIANDGVHPNTFGHRLIARLWLDAYDAG